ncbi:MAG: flagellar hook-associated protein FlgL [Rhodoferax sp.]|uniref:flagellar hook-associated protein FlgL n=1 Tax=Rhodoferax sp. TaxID=50421 RepID=UPI002614805C|nr:flagellar hook-associated protein FlgL [Rhodoferax sp.]MDD2880931.1 flagellar hook-associated protein FlgL [Rhodoferax sp.]
MSTLSNARLGSANTYDNAVRNITSRQSALSALQENLTSGKRVVRASDDPTSAAIAERALTRISRIATDQRALASQVDAITQAESVLGDVTDALQRFRELTVSAGSGVHSSAERKTIALEMQGLRDQIYSLANREDSNGLPLFSALGSALKPFVGPQATAPDYAFNGLPGQSAGTAVSIPFALDGDSAFMLTSTQDASYNVSLGGGNANLQASAINVTDATLINGSSYSISAISILPVPATNPPTSTATYTLMENPAGTSTPTIGPPFPSSSTTIPLTAPGISLTLTGLPTLGDTINIVPNASLFSVLDNAIKDIGGATSNTTASQAVSQALHNIDIGMQRVSAVRGQAGELLNRADRISGNQEKRSIQMEADRSRAEDLDMVKGISDFQNQQTGYQVAMQTYAQIQKLSLFDFIR